MCLCVCVKGETERLMIESEEGRVTHARTRTRARRHSQTALQRTDSVLTERSSLCAERIGLCSSPWPSAPLLSSPLHEPLSTTRARVLCAGVQARLPSPLCVGPFMEKYISASKLRWRKYGDRRGAGRSLRPQRQENS